MKIKEGFMLRTVADSNIVVPVGNVELNFKGMITLNEVGTLVWKSLSEDTTIEEIANKIVELYEIDEEKAKSDAQVFIDRLADLNMIDF